MTKPSCWGHFRTHLPARHAHHPAHGMQWHVLYAVAPMLIGPRIPIGARHPFLFIFRRCHRPTSVFRPLRRPGHAAGWSSPTRSRQALAGAASASGCTSSTRARCAATLILGFDHALPQFFVDLGCFVCAVTAVSPESNALTLPDTHTHAHARAGAVALLDAPCSSIGC